jgi:methylenetetrahydrofolate dehydrogenase (NADP+)/methenyltetrahydrofolate cyclohydrolase
MTTKVISGSAIAKEIRVEVAAAVTDMKGKYGVTPGLAVVLIGEDAASTVYVRNKGEACTQVGIFSETFRLVKNTSCEEVMRLVEHLNQDKRFHGILVQLPLPPHIDENVVINALDPAKDVDGLHPLNLGRLASGNAYLVPCTPAGIQEMLLRSGHDPSGKHLVVCGRSNIVGKPLAIRMLQKMPGANATVTVCHTGTGNLSAITSQADILVVATGHPMTITEGMVKEGAVVIDVGVNRVEDLSRKRGYRLVGDVDFEGVLPKVGAISPVPGGVGPMTIAMLLRNTLQAAQLFIDRDSSG